MTSATQRSEKSTHSAPVEPPSTQSCTEKRVACFAATLFLLSGAAFATLYAMNLMQYAPITYATAGFAFVMLLICCIRSCCCSKPHVETPPEETTKKVKSAEQKKSKHALQKWLNEMAPQRACDTFTLAAIDLTSGEHLLFLKKENHLLKELLNTSNGRWWPGLGVTNREVALPGKGDSHEYEVQMAKNRLWSATVTENGTLTPLGEALRTTNAQYFYVEEGLFPHITLEKGACQIKFDSGNNTFEIGCGWLSLLISELKVKLKALA